MTAHLPIALFAAFVLSPLQHVDFTGDWYFDRFGGPHGQVLHTPEIEKANKSEEGYKFTFTKDGKYTATQPDGSTNTSDYQYIAKRRLFILGKDTMKIVVLTSKVMELYPTSGDKPAMFLKRSKDGKTAMSAP